jgi:hypothetical protein
VDLTRRDAVQGPAGEGDVVLGVESVFGGTAGDSIAGGPAGGRLWGGGGDDVIAGGPGRDRIEGAAGRDRLSGGAGDDSFDTRDYGDGLRPDGSRVEQDVVDCGSGADSFGFAEYDETFDYDDLATPDPVDVERGCERVGLMSADDEAFTAPLSVKAVDDLTVRVRSSCPRYSVARQSDCDRRVRMTYAKSLAAGGSMLDGRRSVTLRLTRAAARALDRDGRLRVRFTMTGALNTRFIVDLVRR